MKNFLKILIAALLLPMCAISQSNSFKYQGVLRDNQGNLITEEQVSIKVNILASSTDGPPLYTEEHTITTNNQGLVFFNIGEGNVVSGDFSSIVWASDKHDLQIELNRNNTGYISMGITPLLSVPYAMHAQTVENTNDADADPRNEIQTLTISNDTIYLSEGGAVKLPNSATGFSGSFNDLEDVPTNLDTDSTDDFSGNYNDLTNKPNLAFSNPHLSIDGGNSVDLSSLNDADASPTNEIQNLNLAGNILTITNNNAANEIDLSPYLDNTDTQLTETQVDNFVANNGYLTSFTEVDGSTTNEIQALSILGDTISLTQGGSVTLPRKGWGNPSDEALFAVVNTNGDTVFAVYESGVRIYVDDGVTKAARGGFAVATRSAAKSETLDILNVTGDSVRIYLEESTGKAARGGFAVATRSAAKGTVIGDILSVSDDSVRIYLEESTGKAARGGFAVATRSAAKGIVTGDILSVSDDSVRIYLEESAGKAARGGFAVATRSAAKGIITGDILSVSDDSVRIYLEEDTGKAARGGFAVATRSAAKGAISNVMKVTEDSTRIYIGDANAGFGVENSSGTSTERLMRLTEQNYFIGHRTGISIESTGLYNSFFGYEAGIANSTGSYNIFIGYQSGNSNTFGSLNTFMGYQAGATNTGSDNTFIGYKAGNLHQSQGGNVYIGSKAGENATKGEQNVLIGESAGSNLTTARKNNFIGFQAGYNTSYGSRNIFIGNNSGYTNNQGDNNIFLGDSAGYGNINGYKNVYIGTLAGQSDKFGNQNVYIGDEAGKNAEGQYNTFVGYQAGINDSQFSNSYFGKSAGAGNVEGYRNTYLGSQAGQNSFEGSENTFIGSTSGYSHKTGDGNVFIGNSTASMDTNSNDNVIIGDFAATFPNETGGNKNLGNSNVILGAKAGYSSVFGENIGNSNVIVGYNAGYETSGSLNVFIGSYSGYQRSGSDLLCIENSYTYRNSALIEGSFTSRTIHINGDFTFNAGTNSITLPSSRGTNGYVLATNGAGGTSWVSNAKSSTIKAFNDREVLKEIVQHTPLASKENNENIDANSLPNGLKAEDNLVNTADMTGYNYKVNYEQQVLINQLLQKLEELSSEVSKLANENAELKQLLNK